MRNTSLTATIILLLLVSPFYVFSGNIIIDNDGDVYLLTDKKDSRKSAVSKYKGDLSKAEEIYGISDPDKCHANSASLSPDGRYLGIECYCRLDPDGSVGFYRVELADVGAKKKVFLFDHGSAFVFSPDSKTVAIVASIPGEHDGEIVPPGFEKVRGLWVVDIKSGKQKKVETSGIGVARISWAQHDGNIYISNNQQVAKIDPKSGTSSLQPGMQGVDFSPDGRYYIDLVGLLRKSSDNQTENNINRELQKIHAYALFTDWIWEGTRLLVYVPSHGHHVFNLETKQYSSRFSGAIRGRDLKGFKFLLNPVKNDAKGREVVDRDRLEIIDVRDLPEDGD